jgi:hypothetical protein
MSTLKDVYLKAAELIEKNGLYTAGGYANKPLYCCKENDCVCIAGAVVIAKGLLLGKDEFDNYAKEATKPLFCYFDPDGQYDKLFDWNDSQGTKEAAIAILKEIAETL